MLELLAFGVVLGRRAYIGFSLWLLWVLFTIVYLGEHWITDALAGYLYAIVLFVGTAWALRRPGLRQSVALSTVTTTAE
jgi:membrane-associated phospholipid phosphatase